MKKTNSIPNEIVIHNIMNRAIEINDSCSELCRNFKIMESPQHEGIYILRWTTIDITNIEQPIQKYRYECFEKDGTPQLCSIYYQDQAKANEFFENLIPLYTQQFAVNHTL